MFSVFKGNKNKSGECAIVNTSHATSGHGLGSDVYLKRLYHPRETLFCELIIDVKPYLSVVFLKIRCR